MKHNPFESWIFDESELDPQQQEQLEAHLAQCPRCAQLANALNLALQGIRALPEKTAPPNFTNKCAASLVARRQAQERKQARTLAIVLISTALLVATVSLYLLTPNFSLISLAAETIATVISVLSSLNWLIATITGFFQNISAPILIGGILLFAAWVILAVFTLGFAFWKVAFRQSEANK
ncbi:MAG: zf-HC2 domain-containing protein [Anaerolineaceae bacterium]|nr:zf-HC2 domain-containing protein [Anaerolineaceae bacterium]